MTTIAQITEKMIEYSKGNIHDIDHFIRVWTYAKTIGEQEHPDKDTQYILEVAAITHDITCPLCREKYGNTNGKHQETGRRSVGKTILVSYGNDRGTNCQSCVPCRPPPHILQY